MVELDSKQPQSHVASPLHASMTSQLPGHVSTTPRGSLASSLAYPDTDSNKPPVIMGVKSSNTDLSMGLSSRRTSIGELNPGLIHRVNSGEDISDLSLPMPPDGGFG